MLLPSSSPSEASDLHLGISAEDHSTRRDASSSPPLWALEVSTLMRVIFNISVKTLTTVWADSHKLKKHLQPGDTEVCDM